MEESATSLETPDHSMLYIYPMYLFYVYFKYIPSISCVYCDQLFVDLHANPIADTEAVTRWKSIPCLWVVCFYIMYIPMSDCCGERTYNIGLNEGK